MCKNINRLLKYWHAESVCFKQWSFDSPVTWAAPRTVWRRSMQRHQKMISKVITWLYNSWCRPSRSNCAKSMERRRELVLLKAAGWWLLATHLVPHRFSYAASTTLTKFLGKSASQETSVDLRRKRSINKIATRPSKPRAFLTVEDMREQKQHGAHRILSHRCTLFV